MDRGHLQILQHHCPPQHQAKLRMLVNGHDVPDPYYGGPEGFESVYRMLAISCRNLLEILKDQVAAGRPAV
jgi:protein-tyrosine phosphatase